MITLVDHGALWVKVDFKNRVVAHHAYTYTLLFLMISTVLYQFSGKN